ncbi:MAG TPA: extracellular solute-binding protein, partial [Trueperaceae bacterium]
MLARFTRSLLSLGLVAALGAGLAQKTLTVTCRCVEGGVSSAQVQWINEYVIPQFEKAHQGVHVRLAEFGGTDEALKQQYALDLSVGQGADIMGFDGFWVPEFVSAGLLKPLDELAGSRVDDWEGWDHIPDGLEALLGYQGKRYGLASGTDYRMIFYRKDIFEQAGIPNADSWQPTSWQDVLDAAAKIKAAMPDSAPLQLNAGTAMGEATTMQGYYMVLLGT